MHESALRSTKNKILAALSKEEHGRLLSRLEPVKLTHGLVLYEIGDPIRHVYFPNNALISLVKQMSDGKVVEVGLIGNDGMSGLMALMGEEKSPERAIIQIPNGGMRVELSAVKEEFKRGGRLNKLLLPYVPKLMRQVSQTAACNASHTVEERLSRWLLMCLDRIEGNELALTQDFIADMLGTRRATVSLLPWCYKTTV